MLNYLGWLSYRINGRLMILLNDKNGHEILLYFLSHRIISYRISEQWIRIHSACMCMSMCVYILYTKIGQRDINHLNCNNVQQTMKLLVCVKTEFTRQDSLLSNYKSLYCKNMRRIWRNLDFIVRCLLSSCTYVCIHTTCIILHKTKLNYIPRYVINLNYFKSLVTFH